MSVIDAESRAFMPLAHDDDPDDYRPESELAIVVDPSDDDDFVGGLAVFYERIAPGDRIPLHQHTLPEVLFVDEGRIEATIGDERATAEPGDTVFVPARTSHGFQNVGKGTARIHAVFPDTRISIRYLERNPAPGTEGDPPGPPLVLDVRELVEGDPDQAVRPIDLGAFTVG